MNVESEVLLLLLAEPLAGDDQSHCRLCLWISGARATRTIKPGVTETGGRESHGKCRDGSLTLSPPAPLAALISCFLEDEGDDDANR